MKTFSTTVFLLAFCLFAQGIPPAPVRGTEADPFLTNTAFKVSWEANPLEENIVGYRLHEWVSGTPRLVAESTSTNSDVLSATPGLHAYTVTARNSSAESEHSEQMFVMVTANRPGKPTNVRIDKK